MSGSGSNTEKTDRNSESNLLLEIAVNVVSAYVSKNPVPIADLPALIESVHSRFSSLTGTTTEPKTEELKPAVPIKKSVTDNYIICLENGKQFKSLKRHLMTAYGMTPDEYRAKWNLPSDYPMVAPAYAASRSELAKTMGLGRKSEAETAKTPEKRAKSAS